MISAPAWAPGLAFVLDVVALAILLAAWYALRPSLRISPIPKEGAALITTGIYSSIRHPVYVGVLLIGVGFVLTNITWISIAIWIALLATLVYKGCFEDSLLAIKYPEAYNYQVKTFGLFGKKSDKD